jgi:predicted PhzF superfamily epimerase YddE/YHI9
MTPYSPDVARFHLLRVFCSDGDRGGNPLAVFLDGGEVPDDRRQAVAHELGFSETVFVDDAARGVIRIFTPATEMEFAGHPTVGTAWLLAREREQVEVLRVPAGELYVRQENGLSHVSTRPEWGTRFEWIRHDSPAEVDALAGAPDGDRDVAAWAYADESAGVVRARVFPVGLGIAEDEATGLAPVQLCARLGRALDIRQGRDSRILVRPVDGGRVELAGRAVLDGVRDHEG